MRATAGGASPAPPGGSRSGCRNRGCAVQPGACRMPGAGFTAAAGDPKAVGTKWKINSTGRAFARDDCVI